MARLELHINDRTEIRDYPEGTSWQQIAGDFREMAGQDILLVHDLKTNRIQELHKEITGDTEARLLTYRDAPGKAAYARTAAFILLRAIYHVVPREALQRVTVEFRVGDSFYVVPRGSVCVDQKLLLAVKREMESYIRGDLPIKKRNISTDEAVRRFASYGMEDKSKLFGFRRVSRVNIYAIGDFEDYFYGPMLESCAYIRTFDLVPFRKGFILWLPKADEPDRLPAFNAPGKLFSVQEESFRWAEKIGIENIADLNEAICRGEANNLILMQEAFFEKKIGEIAQRISKKDKKILLMAGPSSSGKTSTAHRLELQLRAYGLCPRIISADDYYKDVADRPLDREGKPDFESLLALDTEQFNEDMQKLLKGEAVRLPKYDFRTGRREYRDGETRLSEDDVLIVEGIHCLNEKFSEKLPKEAKYKIYVSALTQLNIDEHNRIPTADCRLIRRMVRDNRTRGYSAENTILRWDSVREGEEKNIFPFQEEADVIFNTAMIYELAVLKQYAEPLLFQIPRSSSAYPEARRLLKFLDYVLSLSPEIIPKTSILREFIGGSCLDVG